VTDLAQRRRAELRRRARRRLRWVAVALAPVAVAAGVAFSPVLDVDTIEVTGNRRASREVVLDAARVGTGDTMLTVDVEGIRERVGRLPQVKTVRVTRDWPATVRIAVTERVPAIAVRRPGRYDVVDIEGVLIAVVRDVPAGTPVLSYPGEPNRIVVNATVDLMRALPAPIRGQVKDLTSDASGSLSFTLDDGAVVVWGTGERAEEKVRALTLLLPQRARRYDLRVPDRPAIVPREAAPR
jgi:cell division protein FtsQ